jgi:hypothetical protein
MRSLAFLGAAIAGVLWSTSGFAGVNLVQNPGFETGDITDWTEAGNWDTPYNHVTTSGYLSTYALYDGNYNYQGLGGVTQNLATVSGQSYNVSLYWLETGSNTSNDGNGPTQLFEVLWDGTVIGSITNSALTYPTWTLLSYSVTGTGTDSITIEGYSNSGYNAADDISVVAGSAVPEPATWAMMLAGFVGLGLLGYRRTAKARVAA